MLKHAEMPNELSAEGYPQQSTSRFVYHPELAPIRPLSNDGRGRSPISPIIELADA